MAGRRLRLTKSEVQFVNYQFLGAARLKVVVTNPDNTDADPFVFLYNRRPPNPYDSTVADLWIGIASVVEMADYPVGEPDVNTPYPFFRSDRIEVDFATIELLNETWPLIVAEISNLLVVQDRLEQLVPTEVVDVGADASDSASSGSSGSSASM